ncbi:hypothetical protein HMN09_00945000 [Mycena chlorophos]|uniref:N-acetyltransferase domain-containing protein n=1 Tax=Mycena chlorophos TaxID=658473 RepID=A0A8H6SJ50_MYCCL|nr:hypothetical protein HMN09_00945000 [Mycena chlorophos]
MSTWKTLKGPKVVLSPGLDGQDEHIETLLKLWEQLQFAAYEPASQPDADLVSFAQTSVYFAVILRKASDSAVVVKKTIPEVPRGHGMFPDMPEELIIGWPTGRPRSRSPPLDRGQPRSVFGDPGVTYNSSPVTPLRFPNKPPLPGLDVDWRSTPLPVLARAARDPLPQCMTPVGLIYLSSSPLSIPPPGQLPELNLGIIIGEQFRGKGYAREALELLVNHAFDTLQAHRIQAALIGGSTKDHITTLLTQMWFTHEGVARGGFYHPLLGEWQDITRFGVIDTHWAMRAYWKPAPKSLWDELFLRQERERTELLRWEERNGKVTVKRSASTETLRSTSAAAPPPDSVVDLAFSDAGSSAHAPAVDIKGKGRAVEVQAWSSIVSTTGNRGHKRPRDVDADDSDSEADSSSLHSRKSRSRSVSVSVSLPRSRRSPSLAPSDSISEAASIGTSSASLVSVPRSESVVSVPSSAASWEDDMMWDEDSAQEWEKASVGGDSESEVEV